MCPNVAVALVQIQALGAPVDWPQPLALCTAPPSWPRARTGFCLRKVYIWGRCGQMKEWDTCDGKISFLPDP